MNWVVEASRTLQPWFLPSSYCSWQSAYQMLSLSTMIPLRSPETDHQNPPKTLIEGKKLESGQSRQSLEAPDLPIHSNLLQDTHDYVQFNARSCVHSNHYQWPPWRTRQSLMIWTVILLNFVPADSKFDKEWTSSRSNFEFPQLTCHKNHMFSTSTYRLTNILIPTFHKYLG